MGKARPPLRTRENAARSPQGRRTHCAADRRLVLSGALQPGFDDAKPASATVGRGNVGCVEHAQEIEKASTPAASRLSQPGTANMRSMASSTAATSCMIERGTVSC